MCNLENEIHLPKSIQHICGQCVLASNLFSFFGGFSDEIPLIFHGNTNPDLNKGTIYSYSPKQPDKIHESTLNAKYTKFIGASTVFNEEIGISITFGGLSLCRNEEDQSLKLINTSNLYAYRWSRNKFGNDNSHNDISNMQKHSLESDFSDFIPIDDVFDAGVEPSGLFTVHNYNQMYSPSMSKSKPSPRCFHSAAWDSTNNLMWVFGGMSIMPNGVKEYLNDTWTWSLYTGTWQKIDVKNPPSPRVGSAMTYLNGKIYLFGGYNPNRTQKEEPNRQFSNDDSIGSFSGDLEKDGDFYYLDLASFCKNNSDVIDDEIDTSLCWQPIGNVPPELAKKTCGAKMFPYVPSSFQSYIIFSGGSQTKVYDYNPNFFEDFAVYDKADRMSIVAYSVESSAFQVFRLPNSLPEISYHSAALDKSGILLVAGGIISYPFHNSPEEFVAFNTSLYSFDISNLFCYSSRVDQSILISISSLSDQAQADKTLDEIYYSDFVEFVKQEIEKSSHNKRVQELYAAFKDHQENHSALDDFIVTNGGFFASKKILEERIGWPPLPSFSIPRNLSYDLVFYAYTGLIDPQPSSFDVASFKPFITFCRQRGLFRLIALEFGANIAKMSPYQFLSLCIITDGGFEGKPLFADKNLSFLKTLFARALPKYHQLVDFSLIGRLHPKLSKFVLNSIHNPSMQTENNKPALDSLLTIQKTKQSFSIPESTASSNLSFFATDSTIITRDGPVFADSSFLNIPPQYLSQSKLHVVKAVLTSSFKQLFDLGDLDDIYYAFRLISVCKNKVNDNLLLKILNGSKELFINFASSNKMFKLKLISILKHIESLPVLHFAIEMIGANGSTVMISNDKRKLTYDSRLGAQLPPGVVTFDVSMETLIALFVLEYCCVRENENIVIENILPDIFDLHKVADELLTICASSYMISPRSLRFAIRQFIVDQLFPSKAASEEDFIEKYPRLFDANLHIESIKRLFLSNPIENKKTKKQSKRANSAVAIRDRKKEVLSKLAVLAASQTKYIENLSSGQIKWLIERINLRNNPENIQDEGENSDSSEDSESDLELFSK